MIVYAKTFYNGTELKAAAKKYLKYLPEDVKGLITQGTSGCAIASAMLALSKRNLNHVSVRKDGESDHQASNAGVVKDCIKYAIVDDFMASGKTVDHIWYWAKTRNIEIVLILVDYSDVNCDLDCKIIELKYKGEK